MTDAEKGIGLGLAVPRAIARAHGGDLTTSPAPEGPGSRFVLTLPRG
jgi:signal transduction histidine kinase